MYKLDKWITYDDITKKFSIKPHKACSDDPGDHDSAMSDVAAIDDVAQKNASSLPEKALPLTSSDSQRKDPEQTKQTCKFWQSDIAKTDVTMTDVGAESN